jgi:hypothetical protein
MICSNPQYFVRKDTVLTPDDLAFLLIKNKKKLQSYILYQLNIKKKPTKIILEGKKPMRKKYCSN